MIELLLLSLFPNFSDNSIYNDVLIRDDRVIWSEGYIFTGLLCVEKINDDYKMILRYDDCYDKSYGFPELFLWQSEVKNTCADAFAEGIRFNYCHPFLGTLKG